MNKNIQYFIKRIFDIIASLGGLIVFSPIIIVVAILVRVNLGSPILFTQDRVGKNNKIFKMMKFRTMKDGIDKYGKLLPDSERLTNFGKILRSTSLDELPELINILKGDMSLIGPRPLLVEYLPLYSEEQKRRHDVLPGLTGWAQINGRNTISWREKFKFDVWYVENWSLKLDMQIFFLTIYKVLKRNDIDQNENETCEYFNGNN
ncbi:sugar transferase [Clostridium perfringens]|uniref:sugar transferase n=1 Tax=Clostridium perfringens TaxID=1502 RepID=UPI001A1F2599|nr:sugar transferase [Clostridium perfringens]ELC8410693.1 sugar transferase [Clostridium perfringens]HAT4131472.1 sugar transferase [Clostridium perfringens]HAT4132488.1 sugar transferase [Clostridium perfringens]